MVYSMRTKFRTDGTEYFMTYFFYRPLTPMGFVCLIDPI